MSRTAGGHLAIWTPHTPVPETNSRHPSANTAANILLCPYTAPLSLFLLASKLENVTKCVLGLCWCKDLVAVSDTVDCLVKQVTIAVTSLLNICFLCLEMIEITKKDREWKVHYKSLGTAFCSLNCPTQI